MNTPPEVYVEMVNSLNNHRPTVGEALDCITNLLRVVLESLPEDERAEMALRVAAHASGAEVTVQ